MSNEIELRNGEGRWIQWTFRRRNQTTGKLELLDVSSAIFTFKAKAKLTDDTYLIEKTDGNFDKTGGANGVVLVNIPASENTSTLLPPGKYISEIQAIITVDTDVIRYESPLIIKESIL